MDIYNEWIVKKKKTGKDIALAFGSVILGLAVCYVLFNVLSKIPGLATFMLLAVAGVIWGIYRVVTAMNLEYEYIFTNGEMDVDKIVNVRSRKSVVTVNARKIEILAHRSHEEFKRNLENESIKKVRACTSLNSEDLYFVLFHDENDGDAMKMLLFNPNNKILDGFKKYNPRRVFINE